MAIAAAVAAAAAAAAAEQALAAAKLAEAAAGAMTDDNWGPRRSIDLSPIIPVLAHAIAVFGDERKAAHWLITPLHLFQGRAPTELLQEPGGIERVEQTLTRIEHNIPS